MISKKIMALSGIAIVILSAHPVYADLDVEEDTVSTGRVMGMINDLGGHGTADNNGKLLPCHYRGTKKVSISQEGTVTTYAGEYRNCRENGIIRDGDYTVVVDGDSILDSTMQRSINGKLFDAVIAGDVDKVRSLIKAKADVNYTESLRNNDGSQVDEWSPLMSSVLSGKIEIMKQLVAGGAWVNYMNSRVVNSLWLAANNGQLDMVKFLAGKQANINNQDVDNVSPLMAAAINGHTAVAEYLIRIKADIHLRNRNGDNALMVAIQNGNTAIARLAVNSGAELNARNNSGATALMIAVVEGNEEMVRLLLEKKADVSITTNSGKSALDYAKLRGNPVVLDMLKNAFP